jgi:signal transduction histidine kinase
MLPNGGMPASAGQPSVLPTKFAPAERYELPIIERQARRFLEISPLLHEVLDALPEMLVALNSARQIVFANRAWQRFVLSPDMTLRGLRPGEVLDCIHAGREPGGCGTSEFCQVCGAARAILTSQSGQASVQECRITRVSGEALDLRVFASPLCAGEDQFTLFSIVDVSHEKRRRTLERIFFHDILNTLTALRASTYMLGRTEPEEQQELSQMITRLVERMVDEITWQRQLTDAENDELFVLPGQIDVASLLKGAADSASQYELAHGITIQLDLPETAVSLHSDRTLLRRVLSNILKNALEASRPGDTVTLGCTSKGQGIEFWVHNPACMPRDVQLQVFQRSFSTKGNGRGLGTYSIKLLTERYLQGRVSFTSTPTEGTVFQAWYPLHLAPAGT